MFLDALKGALPVVMAKFLAPEFPICAVIAAIFVIIGHSKPIFSWRQGRKICCKRSWYNSCAKLAGGAYFSCSVEYYYLFYKVCICRVNNSVNFITVFNVFL